MPVDILFSNDDQEIIETYWNVNSFVHSRNLDRESRNNRNILECKWHFKVMTCVYIDEIIETYWNVNDAAARFIIPSIPEIIETYWNILKCK